MTQAAPDQMTIYSTPWCGYCHRLMKQLDREGVGNQTVPTVVFPDGSALTNPSLAQVKDKLSA